MKLLLIIVVLFGAAVVVSGAEGSILSRLLHRESKVTTTTTPEPRRQLFIHNNVPPVPAGCTAHFSCSKKLATGTPPFPCVKYCLKRIECPNNQIQRGKHNECVQLDEEQVLAESAITQPTPTAAASDGATTENIMMVAMIDFPCQPGYLPDSRGRCRVIWF
ncbi:uncharacterized protein LOC117790221 [Drosophila innubila]|uniref:uncharacterized protein LOC117790221 n=1 Tax=Drosophila innubila TaxID=198719 RepID=UPI00148DA7BC|nr:uncharacterized protein LOC117790221 [Drosophila innubila]